MTTRRLFFAWLLLPFLSLSGVVSSHADVTGTWLATLPARGGSRTLILQLHQRADGKVLGYIPGGTAHSVVTGGSVSGSGIRLEMELKDLKNAAEIVGPLVNAWRHGDVDAIDRITSAEMQKYPHVQKAIFTDRNETWAKQIATWLTERPRVYFIVVGAAHLAGPHGVPALLRKAGYRVDGP